LMWDYLAQHGFGTAGPDQGHRLPGGGPHRLAEIGIINQPGFQMAAKPESVRPVHRRTEAGRSGRADRFEDRLLHVRAFVRPSWDCASPTIQSSTLRRKPSGMKHVGPDGHQPRFLRETAITSTIRNWPAPTSSGWACAFCHVGPDPVRPPADPENPKWENLNDFVGAQYLKVWAVFVPKDPKTGQDQEDSFVWQLIHSNPQGDARYVVHRHRLSEQSRHHERGLLPRRSA